MKRLFKRFLGLFPTRLPIGMTEFDKWANDIIEVSGLPNNDSTVFSLASTILHANPTAAYKSKEYFVRLLLKAAANQVAAGVMQDLKDKQKALFEAQQKEAAEKQLGLTASSEIDNGV